MPLANACTMFPTIDERAEGFFFATYVVGMDSSAAGDSIFGPDIDQVVLSSVKAVGLASLANYAHVPDLVQAAKKQYLAAIRLTNTALRSPVDVKKDSTLLAIMILSIYETISGDEPRSLTAWKDHIHGATALLKLRGPEQLRTSRACRIFMQVMASLVVACMQYEIELPDHMMDLRVEATRHYDPNSLVVPYQEAMVSLTNFRARVRRGIICEPHIILAQALELDAKFESMFSDVPPSWAYQTVYTNADPDIVFCGYYHVYHDFLAAQIWNGMRTFKILLNETIRNVLLANFFSEPTQITSQEYVAQYEKSTRVLYQMQLDILASVPQHVGYPSMLSTWTIAQLSATDYWTAHKFLWSGFNFPRHGNIEWLESKSKNLPVIRLSGGHLVTWPLYLAAVTDISTKRDRCWIMKILRTIGRSMGIKQAVFLASVVEGRTDIGVWQTQQESRHPQLRMVSKLQQTQVYS
jgi:hypothetical protein